MDIPIMDLLQAAGAIAVPAAGYLGFIHRKVNANELKLATAEASNAEKFKALADKHDDIKALLAEMRGDIKAILGVPQ